MYAIYGNIYHQYTPNVSIYTIHGSYGSFLWGFRGLQAFEPPDFPLVFLLCPVEAGKIQYSKCVST